MIEITIDNGTNEVSAFGLTQWDKGQKLKINWQDMPESFQVHFASRDSSRAIVVNAQGGYGIAIVDIPDELLENSADINAWIYLTDGEDIGESVKRIVLYVRPRAKPQSLVEELERTQQDILENILGDIKESIVQLKKNGTDSEYIPEYLTQQVDEMLLKVSQYQSDDSVVLLVASDAHFKNGDSNSETSLKHMSQAMKLIAESYPVDFGAYLGDMTSSGSDKKTEECKKEIMKVNSALFSSLNSIPSFICHGSEDYIQKSYYLNNGCMNYRDIRNFINERNFSEGSGNRERGYFYIDLPERKVRVIGLNTSDAFGTDITYTTDTALMSTAQLQWLCESLDLSEKSDAEKWGIVLLGHHPLDMLNKYPIALRILEAYTGGTSISVMDQFGESVIYDFADKNKAKILAQLHGHLHNYRVSFITESNIPLVCIPNASFYNNNFYSEDTYTQEENQAYAEAETYNKRVNTAIDTAFCIVVIDKETGKINAVHYGAGVDRTIEGTEVSEDSSSNITEPDSGETPGDGGAGEDEEDYSGSYTNLVPTAATVSGVVQNTKGYTENYMLSVLGQIFSSKGYVYTGYIKAGFNDVMRFYGGTYDGTKGNNILVYNSDHKLLWMVILTGNSDASSGLYYYKSGIIEFYPSLVKTGNIDDIAYIRFSTVGKGADLIITRNERITSIVPGGPSEPIVNYVNILKYATDKDGNVYGTDGYAKGVKLNFYDEEVLDDEYVVSGYLIADKEAVIRTKGLLFNGYTGSCLSVYDCNFNLIKCISLNTASDSENGIIYDNNIITFVPAEAEEDFSNIAYFRISGIDKGNEFVISYCEEIA